MRAAPSSDGCEFLRDQGEQVPCRSAHGAEQRQRQHRRSQRTVEQAGIQPGHADEEPLGRLEDDAVMMCA